ncbi:MAG: bifunctional folylpolyglutamate synthase/dihydrofolate synthase, partial [Clostridia bacterium]|nr:bifunctional folylpolyglutamate synthase/dihydrofolate synthase [Clostridia bacterium]
MTYSEAIDYIMSRRKFQKSSGHERIERLLSLLGDPHKRLKFVHIVDTNGKGSVSTALSCITEKSGLKTGLFTSP